VHRTVMKRVSKEVLSPLGVSAISCRAQVGKDLGGRHKEVLVITHFWFAKVEGSQKWG
jgi:hypothetical protein